MISPSELKDIEIANTDFVKLEKEIDDSIKSFHGFYPWEKAIIDGEYSIEVRNIIAKKYKENGWKFVYHHVIRK